MNISRDEAAAALDAIDAADTRVRTVRNYAEYAPFFILWGCIWLGANATTDLAPAWSQRAWFIGIGIGGVVTVLLTIRNALTWKQRFPELAREGRAIGHRATLLGITLWVAFPGVLLIAAPLSPRQSNALISLLWALIYMTAGAFMGTRLFVIGAVTAAAILFGYFFIDAHYFLWMGCVGGGALLAGGLWLRKI
jgi:hypothetical protein